MHKYESKIQDEIKRVKYDLKEEKDGSPWVHLPRQDNGILWGGNLVLHLKELGQTTTNVLSELDIITIGNMIRKSDILVDSGIRNIKKHLDKLTDIRPRKCLIHREDYTKARNPYEA